MTFECIVCHQHTDVHFAALYYNFSFLRNSLAVFLQEQLANVDGLSPQELNKILVTSVKSADSYMYILSSIPQVP